MKRCVTIFLIFMVVGVLFAEKVNNQFKNRSQIEEKTYTWESGSTEFVNNVARDSRTVPNLIDYQGKITDSNSNPITSNVSITFTIYDDATGGSNLWDEIHASVSPVDGLVHVLLGSVDAFGTSLFDGSDLWLGINVNSDGEMNPRLRIVSVPYAIYAEDADNLDGHDSNYFVSSIGDTMTGTLIVNSSSGNGVEAISNSGYAVFGTSITGQGIRGISTNGCGVYGGVTPNGNYNNYYGVRGEAVGSPITSSATNFGLYGHSAESIFQNVGCAGFADGTNGNKYGLMGYAHGNSGTNYGIYAGADNGTTNWAGYFDGNVYIDADLQIGGSISDSGGDTGTSGQVLSSTVTGTDWISTTSGASEINDLSDAKTGGGSVFLGSGAGTNDDETSNNNTGVGISTLSSNSSGIYNTAYGYQALISNTNSYNTAFGANALWGNTSGDSNVGLGRDANYYNQTGSDNTIIGYGAGRGTSTHSKSGNIFIGFNAGYSEHGDNKLYIENSHSTTPLIYGDFTDGSEFVKIFGDFQATGELRDSSGDTGTSEQVLSSTGTATNWVNVSTGDITAVTAGTGLNGGGTSGDVTLNVNLAGSGIATTVSRSDHEHEINDLTDGKSGGNSVFIGTGAGAGNSSTFGTQNTGIGMYALTTNYSGNDNIANGYNALYNNSEGSYNIAIGSGVLFNNTIGVHNIAIGYGAYSMNQTGSKNTIIGFRAGVGPSSSTNRSGNVFFGYEAGYFETGSNKLYIENSRSVTPLIYGDFTDGSEIVKINGDFETTGKTTINDVLKLTPRTFAPTMPEHGEIYVNTNGHIYCYLGTFWKQLDN